MMSDVLPDLSRRQCIIQVEIILLRAYNCLTQKKKSVLAQSTAEYSIEIKILACPICCSKHKLRVYGTFLMLDNCSLDSHCIVTLSKPKEGKSNHLTSNHKYLTSWYVNGHVYSLRTMLISLIVTYKGLTNGQTHKTRNYHLQKVYLYQSLSCILFSISQSSAIHI